MQSPATPSSPAPGQSKLEQLSHLCILLAALNETCKVMGTTQFSSGNFCGDGSLSSFQVFLNKLAQICDTQKGGDTMTALACLKGSRGPEYIFCCNSRRVSELEQTKTFLSDILEFVATNPDSLGTKPLQKQVLWRILEFNFDKLNFYLKTLASELEYCISDCQDSDEGESKCNHGWVTGRALRLLTFQARSLPPSLICFWRKLRFIGTCILQRMPNSSVRRIFTLLLPNQSLLTLCGLSKVLHDCETLIKAIHTAKISPLSKTMDKKAREQDSIQSYHWCQLRHYLGRLHSYRLAAEVLVASSISSPDRFKDFTVRYVRSAPKKRIARHQSLNARRLARVAFPDHSLLQYELDIAELEAIGLNERISEQLSNGDRKTKVHGEVQLHDYLIRNGKTRSSDFWDSSTFIGTSKPPCRLCYFYFNCTDNDFQVQSSHMNIYPKWRLPDIQNTQDEGAVEHYDNLVEDIIGELQDDTERILREKSSTWKRNDSRTNTCAGSLISQGSISADSSGAQKRESVSRMQGVSILSHPVMYPRPPSLSTEESWSHVPGVGFSSN